MNGLLLVVSTPPGNMRDITRRSKDVPEEVGGWIVEDGRRTGKLRDNLGLSKNPMNRYRDENETRRSSRIAQ